MTTNPTTGTVKKIAKVIFYVSQMIVVLFIISVIASGLYITWTTMHPFLAIGIAALFIFLFANIWAIDILKKE